MNNKDISRQYVDTGVRLPEYQVNKLKGGLLNTYLRKRLIAIKVANSSIEIYEFKLLSDEQIKSNIDYLGVGRANIFQLLSNNLKKYWIDYLLNTDAYLTDNLFTKSDSEIRNYYLSKTNWISNPFISNCTNDELKIYINRIKFDNDDDSPNPFEYDSYSLLNSEMKNYYINHLLSIKDSYIDDRMFNEFSDKQKQIYLNYTIERHDYLTQDQYDYCSKLQKDDYIKNYDGHHRLPDEIFTTLDYKLKLLFVKNRIAINMPLTNSQKNWAEKNNI